MIRIRASGLKLYWRKLFDIWVIRKFDVIKHKRRQYIQFTEFALVYLVFSTIEHVCVDDGCQISNLIGRRCPFVEHSSISEWINLKIFLIYLFLTVIAQTAQISLTLPRCSWMYLMISNVLIFLKLHHINIYLTYIWITCTRLKSI